MNKVERLARIFGSKNQLAMAIGRSAGIVTRMARSGRIPTKYNADIRAHLAHANLSADDLAEAMLCLEPDICPTCGQPVARGSVL